jgi:hypothetical protein
VSAGVLTAIVASIVGHALAVSFDVAFFFVAIQPDEARLRLFYETGGWGEELGLPIVVSVVAAVLGVMGGLTGSLLRPRDRMAV